MTYDFKKFINTIEYLKIKPSSSGLNYLKNNLNSFFKDCKCEEVIYNNNADGPFYGMYVIPMYGVDLDTIATSKEQRRITRYVIDIDSKLFNPILDLNSLEVLAILLHEVGHIVNDTIALQKVSRVLNYEIAKTGVRLVPNDIGDNDDKEIRNKLSDILLTKTLRNMTSIFEKNKEEFLADKFVIDCGFGSDLQSAFEKIIKFKPMDKTKNKFVNLIWYVSIRSSLKGRLNDINKILSDGEKMEGSKTIKKLMSNSIDTFKKILYKKTPSFIGGKAMDMEKLEEAYSGITEASSFFQKLKFNSIKYFEDDLYEFKLRVSSIDNENDALDILRSINIRIGLLSEYIETDITEYAKTKSIALKTKYEELRETILKNSTFKKSTYGLYVKYQY